MDKELDAWTGRSWAMHTTKMALMALQWSSRPGESLFDAADRLKPTVFPFHNLFPWTKHGDVDTCIGFLRDWLKITHPIVTMGWGQRFSSILASNCQREYGLPRTAYMEVVGKLILICPDPNNPRMTSILIPHLHPGAANRGRESEEILRAFL